MTLSYLSHCPHSFWPFAALNIIQGAQDSTLIIAPSERESLDLSIQLRALNPDKKVIHFPEWDCLPYDRVSPAPFINAARLDALIELSNHPSQSVVVATPGALLQRVIPQAILNGVSQILETGKNLPMSELIKLLLSQGYQRRECVYEQGDFAVRGGIIDVFPSHSPDPVRIDYFGDVIESLRLFGIDTQKTTSSISQFSIFPSREVMLNESTIALFRQGYREAFGLEASGVHSDPLFKHVNEGRYFPGLEHWLPLFYDHLETLWDYGTFKTVFVCGDLNTLLQNRFEEVLEYYKARSNPLLEGDVYRALPPKKLYILESEWHEFEKSVQVFQGETFERPQSRSLGVTPGINLFQSFSKTRKNSAHTLKEILAEKSNKQVVFTAINESAKNRLTQFLENNDIDFSEVETWPFDLNLPLKKISLPFLVEFPLDHGFETPQVLVITDKDVFGERLETESTRRRNTKTFFEDVSALSVGDIVTHMDHGVGRYDGLETLTIGDFPHDCLRILYAEGSKLFLPVENIHLISRYGGDQTLVQLDRLGSDSWQNRKAKVRKHLAVVADYLIRLAAQRKLQSGVVMSSELENYGAFCSSFPYQETQDQQKAIDDVLRDLAMGKPMDRLVCGDVGFGKTEVAIRAAFIAAQNGKQVAIITPTSLLCRQHYLTLKSRLEPFGIRVCQLSRLVSASTAENVKNQIDSGECRVVVGTHALLGEKIKFNDLGLLIVDEEQHFGVKQKEKLKTLKSNVHVLTLTATPIPRTLQLSLTGVRDLSLITTAPVDRRAVRTFIMPFDGLTIREAILREYQRGGQIFYVTPRIEDIEGLKNTLSKMVPEIRMGVVHGQLSSVEIENLIGQFCDGKFDLLLSTNIIESGIDIPRANTLIVHRSNLFGLSQLYQLRGRVGRSKVQGYAYFTYRSEEPLGEVAQKRLEVIQKLDALGAGFNLASHDMEIRGAGNVVGEEQSGHIREVGVELYQTLLQEAIIMARAAQRDEGEDSEEELELHEWTPQINVGTAVLIPETYIPDLGLRLSFYRRIGNLRNGNEIEMISQEMVDRFGHLPLEVKNLFDVVQLKLLCWACGISNVDAGPKGLVIGFYNNQFSNPQALLKYLQKPETNKDGFVKLRPDQKIAFAREWSNPKARLLGTRRIMMEISQL